MRLLLPRSLWRRWKAELRPWPRSMPGGSRTPHPRWSQTRTSRCSTRKTELVSLSILNHHFKNFEFIQRSEIENSLKISHRKPNNKSTCRLTQRPTKKLPSDLLKFLKRNQKLLSFYSIVNVFLWISFLVCHFIWGHLELYIWRIFLFKMAWRWSKILCIFCGLHLYHSKFCTWPCW